MAGDFIYVSGILGTKPNTLELVEGGNRGPKTTQTLRHIETILKACDAALEDVVKVNVFLADMGTFARNEPGLYWRSWGRIPRRGLRWEGRNSPWAGPWRSTAWPTSPGHKII